MVHLQPKSFASKRWQSKDVLRFVFPAGNHVVLPVALLEVNLPCVLTGDIQRVYTTNVHLQWARHGLSCPCLRKHLERRNLPSGWDISTCEHFCHPDHPYHPHHPSSSIIIQHHPSSAVIIHHHLIHRHPSSSLVIHHPFFSAGPF